MIYAGRVFQFVFICCRMFFVHYYSPVSNTQPTPPDNMKTYIVTAKPGMSPFATVTNLREAKRVARQAKRLGLDGTIIVR